MQNFMKLMKEVLQNYLKQMIQHNLPVNKEKINKNDNLKDILKIKIFNYQRINKALGKN